MRAHAIEGSFGLENLNLVEGPDPRLDQPDERPGAGEVLLRMLAVSLNFRDLMMIRGDYNPKQPLPLVPCSDGVGEVVAVGDGVRRVAAGDRVATIFAQEWLGGRQRPEYIRSTLGGPLDGTLRELMTVRAAGVVPVPDHLTDEEAACLPCAGVTAWHALTGGVVDGGGSRVKAGDTVLTLGTGGVSIFALQLARLLGARVIVTSSADEKLERARQLGAWETINYREVPEWGGRVRELTGGRGVDHVIEVGGARTLPRSLQAVRPGGEISMIGVLSGTVDDLNILPILMRGIRIQGVLVGSRQHFEDMNRAVEAHRMRPVVDRVFPFEEAREAFEHMAAARHFGKICIRVAG
ncbi:MAG: NAD(P)-dependent alcohol dehydrogenase [Acidobacteriota bacterium]|jgi:NADPH:quinone reductase-like Zn-dependent oxidoreductase